MAMSFSRPDPASPAAVADASFKTSRRGFDQGEVHEFLRMVAAELGRLQERERFLERELRNAQSNPDLNAVDLDDAALTRLLGEETARVLTTARESANEIRDKAERSGAQLLMEASDEAARVREEADTEADRRRADAAADAESEIEMAKQQGREMVNEARAYRERVLSELARRRELAREQIEQLIHGRDRLTQAFERARLVAADVVAELEPLGEPNEYVNLSPTTGPVPVMVANEPPPATSPEPEPEPEAEPEPEPEAEPVDAVEPTDADEPAVEDEPIDADERAVADEPVDADERAVADEPVDADEGTLIDLRLVEDRPGETDADAEADEVAEEAAEEAFEEAADGTSVDTASIETASIETASDAVVDDPADDSSVDAAEDSSDEVVVDLFARLRAETDDSIDDTTDGTTDDTAVDAVGDAADEAAGGADDVESAAATGSATLVGDLAEPSADTDDAVDAMAQDAEETPFGQRDAELTPIIVACAKLLKRVLADEQNEVLEALRRGEAVTDIDNVLPTADDHLARYRDAIADELLAAANLGSDAITAGRVRKLRKKPAEAARDAAADVIEEWLVVPLRERLDRCVAEGDGDNAVVSRRARSVYREWKTQHIDEQLDDVARTAYGRGAFEAVEAGTPLVWSVDGDHPACPDCDDNGLAGPVAAGDEFPTGHLFAPAHPGCRCLLLPPGR